MANVSFTAAMKTYFGIRAGRTVSDFAMELKELTYEDKLEFHRMLTQDAKIECDPPTAPAAK